MPTTTVNDPTFRALVDRNRKAGRLEEAKPEPQKRKTQLAGMRLRPEELDEARQLAAEDERPVGTFIRRVYLRGLEDYKRERANGAAQ